MTTRNPWALRGSKIVYENQWMRVREDDVLQPSGSPGIYAFVEKSIATGVAALTENNEVYLVGQYRYPMEEYSWEIVEGGAEPGETAQEAASRELMEEAGLQADHWEPLGGEIHISNSVTSERGYLFLAKGLHVVTSQPDETEILQIKRVPLPEAISMIDRGEIKDSLTIIALLLLAKRLGL